MLQPQDFFDLKEFEHKALFEDVEFVWEALVRLKSYMKETLTPNVAPLSRDMLSKTCVLWGGKVIEDGFEIEAGDASKGELRVLSGGSELEGASFLCAGSTLSFS